MSDETKPEQVSILSIEAWRNADGGWDWNNWHRVGWYDVAVCDLPPRQLLARLRADGYLAATSAGRVRVEDDGYNVVVLSRGTSEPLFAIAYGEVQS